MSVKHTQLHYQGSINAVYCLDNRYLNYVTFISAPKRQIFANWAQNRACLNSQR
uniref:Uncharacterized protein n=1 Tax=Anguilla anguilla TaxID=7936 RepID=A0A0E9WCH7_ANGAN